MIERIEINLLPAEYRVHRRSIKLQREYIYPVIAVGIAWAVLGWVSISMTGQILQKQQEIKIVDDGVRKNSHVEAEIEKLKTDCRVIDEKNVALERISVNREKWVRLLELLCSRLPRFTWVTSVEEKPPVLRIQGRTYSFPEVANFMTSLQGEYITSVDLANIERVGGEQDKSFQFGISATVNPNAGLEGRGAPGGQSGGAE